MNSSTLEADAEQALATITAGINALLGLDLERLDRDGLLGLLTGLEIQVRRLPAVDHRLVAAVQVRGIAGELGSASAADLLRLAPGEAAARICAARDLGPRQLAIAAETAGATGARNLCPRNRTAARS